MTNTIKKYAGFGTLALLVVIVAFGIWDSYVQNDWSSLNIPALSSNARTPSPVWDIGELGEVRMFFENTKRYELDTDIGVTEWEALVPEDGGIIYQRNAVTGELEPFTISLFHQLRCLNVLRLEFIRPTRFTSHALNAPVLTHCFNYLRQTILCRSSLHIEAMSDPLDGVDFTYPNTCKDWRKVYDAAATQTKVSSIEDKEELL